MKDLDAKAWTINNSGMTHPISDVMKSKPLSLGKPPKLKSRGEKLHVMSCEGAGYEIRSRKLVGFNYIYKRNRERTGRISECLRERKKGSRNVNNLLSRHHQFKM